MARAPDMEGPPTTDVEKIHAAANRYRELQTELTEKRLATKETTGGKTKWRKDCADEHVDPVILADAVELVMKLEKRPKQTTREWRVFVGYLKGLGFFDKLVPGLFDEFETEIAAQTVDEAA